MYIIYNIYNIYIIYIIYILYILYIYIYIYINRNYKTNKNAKPLYYLAKMKHGKTNKQKAASM